MDEQIILPAFYLPPVSYFSVIHNAPMPILLEQYEHYPKQTYRTRASVYSANGKLDLIVPVKKGRGGHTRMKDVRISYESDWQRLHWMSLQTAYRSSAYFEYYEEDFMPFYQQRYEWLFDYNVLQLQLLLRLLKITRSVGYTESYRENYPSDLDFRQAIHPKTGHAGGDPKPYYQVFENKHGFIAGLSIVDLLFNHGPQSRTYL
ncbi:WbqC family protein [Parapedobacter sp. ISTM3]|uniref:WbqC-like protein family protein n=1 Tax=Parapedobacter luteus TaxID=623280 RepID=A0A1T5C630_9SPHI|nr:MULTISPECIES: WbqC family protein [Parapedobacter]MBK1439229.1 WbqC family protein [Parapedobacter sp. ISTM3]SKB54836.1 WbqC-like protein family protein [Parapedobacter luteus]